MSQVKITAGNVSLPAELNNNPTAQKIWNMLPIDNNKPKAYSPVNILGRVLGDATQFRDVPNGALVRVESVA